MKYEPMFSNIIIKKHEAKSVTEGGIHLPGSAEDRQARGPFLADVVKVGPGDFLNGVTNKAGVPIMPGLPVEPGDTVLINPPGRLQPLKDDDGEEYIILHVSSVMCKIKS